MACEGNRSGRVGSHGINHVGAAGGYAGLVGNGAYPQGGRRICGVGVVSDNGRVGVHRHAPQGVAVENLGCSHAADRRGCPGDNRRGCRSRIEVCAVVGFGDDYPALLKQAEASPAELLAQQVEAIAVEAVDHDAHQQFCRCGRGRAKTQRRHRRHEGYYDSKPGKMIHFL